MLILFLVISCKNNSIDIPEKPSDLISKNKMVEVIYDISLINSAKGVNKKLIEIKGIVPEDYVYKKHNIDSLQFALSNEYYAYNLKTYEEIYNSVKAKLEKDKTHFNALIASEQKIKDSINKSKRNKKDTLIPLEILNKKKRNLKRETLNPSPLKNTDTSQLLTHQ